MDRDLSPRFSLSLLGPFRLNDPGGVIELPSRKLAALLAYLACTAPKPQRREALSALLWGSHFDLHAKQNLRQALFRLRRVLGQDALAGDGEVVSLNPAAVSSDVARFGTLVRDGSRDALRAAAELYRGPLVDDVAVSEEGWSEWLTAERGRLQELALGALMGLGEQELAAGRAEHALNAGQRAIALNSMREDAHRLIVRALAAAGRRAEALKHYEDLVALLGRELNAEPDAATRSLAAELRIAPQPTVEEAVAAPIDASAVPARSADPERRQLTIMACTIVRLPLSGGLDPEDLRDRFAALRKAVDEVAARFDGFVAQHQGDSALVYFGYPTAHEHDPEQAVRAGLAMLDAAAMLTAGSDVTHQARVGIASGLVVVGDQVVAGDARQHLAIGEAPNLAAQLRAVAEPGTVIVAASTRRLVGRMFDCRALAANEREGLPPAVEAWQVRGENAGIGRFEARRADTLSPLVGRQEEMALLQRRWDQAKLGEGRVVLLSGEPGIGKSRIAENLVEKLEGEPHARIRYFCSPHHTHSPLYPVITQLERAAGFEPGSSTSAKLDKLEALLKPTARNGPADLALIVDLLSVPTDGRYPALTMTPQQKREMTLTALLDLLAGAAAESPILIVFEDVHWIDPTSLDLLDQTIARVADLPVLLLVTVRPEFQPTWIGQPHVTMLSLSRLGRRDSAGIIAGVTKDKSLPDAVVEQVLAHTDGVPLFIEELTSTLIESGLLRETPDRYVLDGPLPPLAIPTTLQASLAARLDRLASPKDVAQIGAAIGREFSHELIAAVSALAPIDLDTALGRLTASGLISRRGMPPDATYSFKHALVQDAAYATMLKSRRRQLHASIARLLVEQFSAVTESQPELVAHHFTEAGLANQAVGYWVKAGRLAHARSANREAVNSYVRALSLLEALPESAFALEQGFEIRLELRPGLIGIGEIAEASKRLREAEALAERSDDDYRRARVGAFMTNARSLRGELDAALASGNHALEVAGRVGDVKLRGLATMYLEQVHYSRGEYKRAVELAMRNLAASPADRVDEQLSVGTPGPVWDRMWLVMSLAELGRFAEATEHQAEAIRLAELTDYNYYKYYGITLAYSAASMMHLLRGDWANARSVTEHWIGVMRAEKTGLLLPFAVASSAWILAQLGEEDEAVSRLRDGEQLLGKYAAAGFVGNLGWFYHALARACLLLGRLDEARRLGDRAIEISPSQAGFAAHALHLLGDVATHPDRFDADRGEAHYREALALAEPRGMRPLVAHCHRGLGTLYRRTSRRQRARQHLTAAMAMYREMDMAFWLERAQGEMHRR
jgi:predicted ATPase